MELLTETKPYLPGTASLIESLDRRVLVVLRDGKQLVGNIRSFDQYSNLVLEDTCERIVVGKKYSDIPLGLFIVRGDNLVLCGEVDEAVESSPETYLEKVEYGTDECNELRMAKQKLDQEQENAKKVWNFDS